MMIITMNTKCDIIIPSMNISEALLSVVESMIKSNNDLPRMQNHTTVSYCCQDLH